MDSATIRQRYGPWALVAGASEGLGAAFADTAASHGLNVVLVARRQEALEATAQEICERRGVETRGVVANLGQAAEVERALEEVRDLEIGTLICNAAREPQGPFVDIALDDHLDALEVNCRAPMVLAHALGRPMVARKRGAIVLVSSLGGLCGLPVFSSYGASKAFDWNLGECLWYELSPHGVDALTYVVGSTRTPNLERSGAPESHLAQATAPEVVAEQLFRVLDQGPTQYPLPEIEQLAQAMFSMPREGAIRMIGEANAASFPSKV